MRPSSTASRSARERTLTILRAVSGASGSSAAHRCTSSRLSCPIQMPPSLGRTWFSTIPSTRVRLAVRRSLRDTRAELIEVELTAKRLPRYASIFEAYRSRLDRGDANQVTYVCSARAARGVETAPRTLPAEHLIALQVVVHEVFDQAGLWQGEALPDWLAAAQDRADSLSARWASDVRDEGSDPSLACVRHVRRRWTTDVGRRLTCSCPLRLRAATRRGGVIRGGGRRPALAQPCSMMDDTVRICCRRKPPDLEVRS